MKFEHTNVYNFENAIRGARHPKLSYDRMDSYYDENGNYIIGPNDMKLLQTLVKSGSDHRKFMRQILVSADITASQYWFSEYDTYKVGTVANSTSKMYKIHSNPITLDCFEFDDELKNLVVGSQEFYPELDWGDSENPYKNAPQIDYTTEDVFNLFIDELEKIRLKYLETKDKRYWKALIQLLPESWLQTRTCTLNYEVLFNMCKKDARRNHKLTEWSVDFMNWVRSLPYAQELIFIDELE